ncbi:hypothetical protein PCASD_20329 [Puccinia coronata f. sp. avenae]|uniref:Uncharacterized protein n=1 Tax=Puccinia coronata f. sp. avenae TaxID=200324 RepID=A0A2N5U344_9BASI|nr:hypothetical protein PCASD_20329 [Puccinia coronata f. sp. avenae]
MRPEAALNAPWCRWDHWPQELGPLATGAKTNGDRSQDQWSSSWSSAACNLWHQLELLVSAPEANAPNSGSCWSQRLRPMVPAAGPVGLRH